MIIVIGMGPGGPEYITPKAAEAIAGADVLAGSSGWLKKYSDHPAEKIEIHPINGFISALKEAEKDKVIVVMVSGDPGLFSLSSVIKREAPELRFEVIAGVSSAQVLFARLGLDWSGVDFVSLHGRPMEKLEKAVCAGAKLCIFTDSKNSPREIGLLLLRRGLAGKAVVGSDISTSKEKIAEMSFDDLVEYDGNGQALVYLEIW